MQNILLDTTFTFLSFFLHPRPSLDGCRSQSDTETPLATIIAAIPNSRHSTVASYSYFINLNN